MYRQTKEKQLVKNAVCDKCGSTRMLYQRGSIICSNCGNIIYKPSMNKYRAKRTEYNGKVFDSKFEAGVAEQLEMRKIAGDIKDYDCQFVVESDICNSNGEKVCTKKHKVDFRIHHNDGSFELYEAKGIETMDYKLRRDIIVGIWLSEHKDYIYTVVKQKSCPQYKKP